VGRGRIFLGRDRVSAESGLFDEAVCTSVKDEERNGRQVSASLSVKINRVQQLASFVAIALNNLPNKS